MPKLNTTVDNLELKSNKIVSTSQVSPANWTDTQYPSAKTLLNIAHPIGSVLTTSTNENPSAKLGGTWELVDKALKGTYMNIPVSSWTANKATLNSTSNVLLMDHTINLRVYVNITDAISSDADVVLGKLNLATLGVTALSSSVYRQPAVSDAGNCVACYTLESDGTITINDVLSFNNTHSAAANTDFIFNILFPVGYDRMIDDFCDKFYWKRTA